MSDWKSLKTALPAVAFALSLASVPAIAQNDDQQGSGAQQAEPQANDQGSQADEDMATGPSATVDSAASGQHALPFEEMDDAALTTQLSTQGYLNARDFDRRDGGVWLNADRDGQLVRVVVLPMAFDSSIDATLDTTAQVGGTDDADGGDGGSPATAEGGAAVGIGDASGGTGGDGGSTSLVARQDNEAVRTHITSMGYTNPRDFKWSSNSVWAVADRDGEIVHIYLVPNASVTTVQ